MKFSFSHFLVLAVTVVFLIPQASAQVVEIPDPNLRVVIRETLQIPAGEPITQQDMLKLTWLDGRQKNITNLTGLEYATNLTDLSLVVNAIQNLEPLAGLMQLQTLDLSDNQIVDITPLANLTNLTGLEVSSNQLRDLNPLVGLTGLTFLGLWNNRISDLTPLMNLTALQTLWLNGNAIVDITPLANLTNLTELTLSSNQLRDLNPLMNLTALEILWLNGNTIVDITPLSGLKNLKELRLADNPIRDFRPLAQLVGVQLDLEIDLSRLDQLHLVVTIPDSNLERAIRETLSLPDGVPFTQLEMLRLTELEARQRDINDLTGIEYGTNLVNLYLDYNRIEDITPLANLTKLRDLDLAFNAIESAESLASLIQLEILGLSGNLIHDITPLANLINLQRLFINETLVTDITPLQGLALIEFFYDEVCDFPPLLPPVRERLESRSFPSIFQMWDEVLGVDHLTKDQRAALHDLTTRTGFYVDWDATPTEPTSGLATSLGGNLALSRERLQRRISLNPNMVSLDTINFHTHFTEDVYPPGSDFWLRDENGEIIRHHTGSPFINFLKPEVQELLVKRVVAIARCGLFDGVMIDQFVNHGAGRSHIYGVSREEMIQAFLNIFRAIREQVRDDFLILINTNRSKATRYTEYVNGTFMEAGHDYVYMSDMPGGFSYDGLKGIESTLSWSEENLRSPQINCLEGWGIPAEEPDSLENQRWMRVITTLSLTHSDGYVMYTTGWGSVKVCPECPYPWGPGHEHIWYDFWDADLGRPIGPKVQYHQNIEDSFNGLFIREFTNGWAVYNRSGEPQTITLPASATPVSDRGNNAASQTHLLPDLDGEIYLKAKNPADVNGDWEVNVLDLVQVANGLGKATPDPNGDGEVNILDLVFVAQQFSE